MYAAAFPLLAAKCSLDAFPFLFGGTLSWLGPVLMCNDSGEHPWAPYCAAACWCITLPLDLALLPLAICAQVFYALTGLGHHAPDGGVNSGGGGSGSGRSGSSGTPLQDAHVELPGDAEPGAAGRLLDSRTALPADAEG